jgi:hypothetical protein
MYNLLLGKSGGKTLKEITQNNPPLHAQQG